MIEIMGDLLKLSQEYGPILVIVLSVASVNIFFIWQSVKREERQQQTIIDIQNRHDSVIVPIMSECRDAISSSKEVIKQNSQLLMSWIANAGR